MFQGSDRSGMITEWQQGKAFWTPTASPGFVQGLTSRGYLAIRRLGLFGLYGVKKNGVRQMWNLAPEFLRSSSPADSRPVVRGDAYLPGSGDPQGSVSTVWQSEAGEVSLARGQPVLHEALCLVCGPTLPGNRHQERCERAQTGLEDGEEPGDGLYAGAAPAHRNAGPQGHWH